MTNFVTRRARPLQRLDQRALLVTVAGLPVVAIVGLLLLVMWISFRSGVVAGEPGYGLEAYRDLLADPLAYRTVLNTAVFSLVATATACFFGVPAAWLVERTNLPMKGLWFTLMTVGVLIPGFLTAMGWVFLLHPRIGIINTALASIPGMEGASLNVATPTGMGFVQGLALTPVAFIFVAATFRSANPALEEAAAIHGIGPIRTLFRVTLPLAFPGILAAGIYIVTIAIATFEVPAIIGLGAGIFTFSTFLFLRVIPQEGLPKYEMAGAFSVVMILVAILLLWWYFRVLRLGYRYGVVSGKAYTPKRVELGRWKPVAYGFLAFYFLLAQVLPLLITVWSSLIAYIQPPSMAAFETVSLANYRGLPWSHLIDGTQNTAILMVSVATLTLVFSLAISWVVTRSDLPGRFALDVGAFLPHSIPNLIFAVAMIFAALFLLQPIYGTIFVLMAAYVLVRISFGTRIMNSAMIQVHNELDEAGQVSGIPLLQRLRRILLPLVSAAMLNVWLWTALLTYRELTMATFLATSSNTTLPTVIWGLWSGGSRGQSAAATSLGMALMIPLIALYWFFGSRRSQAAGWRT